MRRMLKWTLNIAMIFSFTAVLAKQNGGGPRPELTDEQRQCMDSILGKPGEGERPSREVHEAAEKKMQHICEPKAWPSTRTRKFN